MTWDGVQERRRGPRVAIGDHVDCRFEIRAKVRLVDISAAGALLETTDGLPVHTSGRLKAVLAAGRFSPNLQIRRTAPCAPHDRLQLGTIFVGMDDESRRSLDTFLKKATS